METKKFEQIARDEAAKSDCTARQVGAVLVNALGHVLGQGHNNSPTCDCIKNQGACTSDVIHAEVACLNDVVPNASLVVYVTKETLIMYVTQPPCNECLIAINNFMREYDCIIKIHICEQFLKFDDDKLRFDLIPDEWELYDAKVLTYGAKKYKPENWRKGELKRFKGAYKRHMNAYYRGEWLDPETGLPHIAHARTNLGFILTIEEEQRFFEGVHCTSLTTEVEYEN